MKLSLLFLVLCLLCACSQKVVLQTDSDESIDLSGRWNNTDAEIIESALFNQLMGSAWLTNYQIESNFKPKIVVKEFQTSFDDSEAGKYLQQLFEKSIIAKELLDLSIEDDSGSYDYFILVGSLQADNYIEMEERKAINYNLSAQLKDRSGMILWEGKEEIKKYIKE